MAVTKCNLTRADEPECLHAAVAVIVDTDGKTGRGCLKHAIEALDGIKGARVDWSRSKGLNEFARKALELSGGGWLLAGHR